jgi:hypothetical protein
MDGKSMKGLFILPFAPFIGGALVALAYAPAKPQQPGTSISPGQKKPQLRKVSPSKQTVTIAPPAFRWFKSEAMAKAYCAGETVVWTDTKLKVYHSAGSYLYGRTRFGGYMCEKDTASAGFRPAAVKQDPPQCCGTKTAAGQISQ